MEIRQDYASVQRDITRFAENLVRFIIDDVFEDYYPSDETENFNEETCMELAFNDTMRRFVKFIYLRDVKDVCMKINHISDKSTYVSIFRQMGKQFHSGGMNVPYNAGAILYFCVEVTIYAKIFKEIGFIDAPNVAVSEICTALEGNFATRGRWNSLNTVAKVMCANIPWDYSTTGKSFSVVMADSQLQIATFEASSSGTHSHCAEPRMMDKNVGIFSHGSGEESEMQIDDPEHTSGISENKSRQHFQFPNVSVQKRHLETDDDVGSIGLAKKARLDFN